MWKNQVYISNTLPCPDHPNVDFDTFHQTACAEGFIIYPGKFTDVDSFRINHIGRLYPADMETRIDAICKITQEMGLAFHDEE